MRVLIVADNAISAEAIRRGLRQASPCRVIGFIDGRKPYAVAADAERPDLVVVDEMSCRQNALARVRDIRAALPGAKVILLTVRSDPEWLALATAAGIHAAVSKTVHPGSFGTLVREIASGNVYHAFEQAAPAPNPAVVDVGLTGREQEILRHVAAGASNSAIAALLWVTEQTVKFHLSNIYRKLGVANRTQASHYAHLHGLLDARPAVTPLKAA